MDNSSFNNEMDTDSSFNNEMDIDSSFNNEMDTKVNNLKFGVFSVRV